MPREPIHDVDDGPVDHDRVLVVLEMAGLALPEQTLIRCRNDRELAPHCVRNGAKIAVDHQQWLREPPGGAHRFVGKNGGVAHDRIAVVPQAAVGPELIPAPRQLAGHAHVQAAEVDARHVVDLPGRLILLMRLTTPGKAFFDGRVAAQPRCVGFQIAKMGRRRRDRADSRVICGRP
jgi:hypothetical protein